MRAAHYKTAAGLGTGLFEFTVAAPSDDRSNARIPRVSLSHIGPFQARIILLRAYDIAIYASFYIRLLKYVRDVSRARSDNGGYLAYNGKKKGEKKEILIFPSNSGECASNAFD